MRRGLSSELQQFDKKSSTPVPRKLGRRIQSASVNSAGPCFCVSWVCGCVGVWGRGGVGVRVKNKNEREF